MEIRTSSNSITDDRQPPNPRKPGNWGNLWLILALLAIGGGAAFWVWRLLSPGNSAPQGGGPPGGGIPVKIQTVESGRVEQSSTFIGALEAPQRVALRPQIDGRVVEILAAEGDRVAAGTPIVQLRPERNQAEVQAARSNVNIQLANLNNARAQERAARAEVGRQQAQIRSLEAELQSAEADLELAQINYSRTQELVAQGVQPRQDLDDRIRDLDNAIAARDAAAQTLAAARNALESAREQLEAARATVTEVEASVDQARADVAALEEDLSFTRVTAPIDGVLGDIPIRVGDYVEAGDDLTNITQNEILDLRLAIPIERATQLRPGLPVELRTDPEGDPVVVGEVNFVSPQVDTAAQSVLAKARFPNPDNQLRDEQFVRARIIWDTEQGVLIPTTAISRLGGQTFVFVAQNASEAESCQSENAVSPGAGRERSAPASDGQLAIQKPVTLGSISGNSYQVLEGVEPGEQVIVSGLLNLSNCAPIADSAPENAPPSAGADAS